MEKKTSIVVIVIGVVVLIAVILAFALESGSNSSLDSNEILRINNNLYYKDEFEDFIRYTLYSNNGDMTIDTEEHAEGATEESIFISECLDNFYTLKTYEIIAEKENITLASGEIDEVNNEYESNKEKIESVGLSQDRYTYFASLYSLVNKITSNPAEYIKLPDGVYDSYVKELSGDDAKSFTYRIMQVGYTEEEVSGESGEMITSGDKAEKQEFMNSLVARVKAGETFETVAESGDTRIISSNGGYTVGKSALEYSAGVLLDQKIGMFTGNTDLSTAIKKTASGELTEIIDTGNAFQVALVEGVEDGIVGGAKDEVIQALLNESYTEIINSYITDMEVNYSVLSRIKIQ